MNDEVNVWTSVFVITYSIFIICIYSFYYSSFPGNPAHYYFNSRFNEII